MDNEVLSSANILGGYQNVVGSYRGEDYYTYSKDIQGSTSSITDGSFNAKAIYEYSDFGEVTEVVESIDNEICYTGAIHDETTGLHYMNARYYDPANGRFISQDSYRGSVNVPGQWHLYVYCANNPINYTDPSGHFGQGTIHGQVIKNIERRYSWANNVKGGQKILFSGLSRNGIKGRYGLVDVIRYKNWNGKTYKKAQLWELKRKTHSYSKAKEQLGKYVNGKSALYPNAKLYVGGNRIAANNFVYETTSTDYYVEYDYYKGGIIYYDYTAVRKKRTIGNLVEVTMMVAGAIVVVTVTKGFGLAGGLVLL